MQEQWVKNALGILVYSKEYTFFNLVIVDVNILGIFM